MKAFFLWPLGFLYHLGSFLKRGLYRLGVLSSVRLNVPVISVGNLSFGGTGKTPVILFLVDFFLKKGKKVGVVSRGYKGNFSGVCRVDLKQNLNFGDEPMLVSYKFPHVPVYVGSSKSEAARILCEKEDVDLILVDDGFQHWRLHRDLDIVLLDGSQSADEFTLSRESFSQIKRADVVFLTKVGWSQLRWNQLGWSDDEQLQKWRLKLSPYDLPMVEWKFALSGVRNLLSGQRRTGEDLKLRSQGWAVASGLASPEIFEESLKKELGVSVLWHKVDPDHHLYSCEDLLQLCERVESSGAQGLLVTEKNFMGWQKLLPQLGDKASLIWVTELEISPSSSVHWQHVSSDYFTF